MAETELTETADYDKSATPTAHASSHESAGADAIDNLGPLTSLTISADGIISWSGASASNIFLFDLRVSGDTYPRFTIRSDGRLYWGSGSSALDSSLVRASSYNITCFGSFTYSYGSLNIWDQSTPFISLTIKRTGESQLRFSISSNGIISFGSGASALDCQISRRAADILNTPDRFEVGTLGVANSAAGTTPGTCQNKAEIFDAAGNSLGFIAIYDAIT